MLSRAYRFCCCFIAVLLALASCSEPLGFGVYMGFFLQTCESMAVRGVFTNELACHVSIKGNEAKHDSEIESVARDWFYGVHPGMRTARSGSTLIPLHYTLDLCTGIKVLFEDKDISENFFIRLSEDSMCLLTKDKIIIDTPASGLSIADFIQFSPLVPVNFELFSVNFQNNEMIGRTFTIELEIDNARTLTAKWVYEPFNG